jgi:poly [ADP-ribose] polymerase
LPSESVPPRHPIPVYHTHTTQVQDIFRVARAEEETRFANSKYANLPANLSDRRLLWHGSRCTNYGGILSQGLRIAPPEAPVSGYMFGKGVYLADISSKSANYCFASMSANIGLLLLCEAELGKPMLELKHANADAGTQALGNGHFTTLGRGETKPVGWKDAGVVHESLKGVMMPDAEMGQETMPPGQMSLLYNEYIAYDVAQIRLRYLLRVEMKYGSSY